MKREYRNLMQRIRVPEKLDERVLSAARQREQSCSQREKQPVWRVAVCAVLAMALVAGGVTLQPRSSQTEQQKNGDLAGVLAVTCEFGLTAYAAEAEADKTAAVQTTNGSLLLGAKSTDERTVAAVSDVEQLQYTDYRFRIQGESLQTVRLTIDRGGLYRYQADGENTPLGAEAVEDYDPDAVYGLWTPVDVSQPIQEQTLGSALFDGANLTVTVGFADGTEQTLRYGLTAQRLEVFENENGARVLIPALEGSVEIDGVFGLYAEPENGVWLKWPVAGANMVSLSQPFGFPRWQPGGKTAVYHAGIDIPADSGVPITAAAGGTVRTAGFDADEGNYLILDHGNGMETVYAQCLRLEVEAGDCVTAGQEIAAVGSTGKAVGPHLHFEVRQNGEAQNPVAYFENAIREMLYMG